MWTVGSSAKPGPDGTNWLELGSPLVGELTLVERDALAAILLGRKSSARDALQDAGLMVEDSRVDRSLAERAALWRSRGWGTAIDWYLWSRRPLYRDDGQGAADERLLAMQEYAAKENCPPSPLAKTESREIMSCGRSGSLGEALLRRRSLGAFKAGPMSFENLSEVLSIGLGQVRDQRLQGGSSPQLLRSHGSALDVHIVAYDVDDLPSGHYFYEIERRLLDLIDTGIQRCDVDAALGGQPDQDRAAGLIALVADFDRYSWRYRHERALRNLYIDAGRIMGRLLLAASGLGLQTGITPLVHDSAMRDLLDLDGDRQAVLHTLTLGGSTLQ